MSRDLGHSKSYVYNITSGRSSPSIQELFAIIRYFGIEKEYFFDAGIKKPKLLEEIIERVRNLSEDELRLILSFLNLLTEKDILLENRNKA